MAPIGNANGNANLWTGTKGSLSPTTCETNYSLELNTPPASQSGDVGSGANTLQWSGPTGLTDFCITFWIYSDTPALAPTGMVILYTDQDGAACGGTLRNRGGISLTPLGEMFFQMRSGSGQTNMAVVTHSIILPTSTWTLYSVQVNRATGETRICANADVANETSSTIFPTIPLQFPNCGTTKLGSTAVGGSPFSGNLCHLAVWNTNLTLTDQAELLDTSACYATDFTFSSKLQNYWSCFNPLGVYTNPLPDTGVVGPATPITLTNTTAANVSTNHP
jgi:hypothetical protein